MKLPCLSAVMGRQRGDLTAAYNSLKDSCKGNGTKLLSGVANDLTQARAKCCNLGGSP